MIFGVYSKEPACTKLTNGFTLFDWVVRKNCFPDFWGRSVTEVTPEEIAFLKERDCKVALILDNLGIKPMLITGTIIAAVGAIIVFVAFGKRKI